jgi:hypothetical protein
MQQETSVLAGLRYRRRRQDFLASDQNGTSCDHGLEGVHKSTTHPRSGERLRRRGSFCQPAESKRQNQIKI